MTNTSTQVVRINVDPKLGDIVSTFLEHRQADVGRLQSALDRVEFETIQNLGHDIEGTGATFGFEQLTEIGRVMKLAAKSKQSTEIQISIDELADYLARVELVYR